MYASQLLRILQTFPTHMNHEICNFDTDELPREAMKESPRRYTNPFLSDEENEQLNLWNNQELQHSNINEESFNKSLAPCNLPSELFEKETEFYTDKNVMECELPELLVCYKESAFHVKDICVDEGFPHETFCNSSLTNEDKHDEMIERGLHTRFSKPELSSFSLGEEDCYMNSDLCAETKEKGDITDTQLLNGERREDCSTKSDTSETEEADITDMPIRGPTSDHENIGEQNSIPDAMKECGSKENVNDDDDDDGDGDDDGDDGVSNGASLELKFNVEQIDSSRNSLDSASTEQVAFDSMPSLQQDRPLPSLEFLLESIRNDAHDAHQKANENPVEDTSKSLETEYEAKEPNKSHPTTNGPNESTTGGPETSNDLHGAENPDGAHELGIEMQSAQDAALENIKTANQVHRGEGESSFSMAGPVSGRITYSGPIAFSGSISLRSDSSTTSTRSFAFPVLQTEWNSSPVRMAKAEKRRLQKHRGWRHGLLCCRF